VWCNLRITQICANFFKKNPNCFYGFQASEKYTSNCSQISKKLQIIHKLWWDPPSTLSLPLLNPLIIPSSTIVPYSSIYHRIPIPHSSQRHHQLRRREIAGGMTSSGGCSIGAWGYSCTPKNSVETLRICTYNI